MMIRWLVFVHFCQSFVPKVCTLDNMQICNKVQTVEQ